MISVLKTGSLFALTALPLLGVSAHAQASTWKDLTSSQKRGAMQVIRCARQLAQNGGVFPGGMLAAEALQRLVDNQNDSSRIREIVEDCKARSRSLFSGKMEQDDPGFARQRERYAEWLTLEDFPFGTDATSSPIHGRVSHMVSDFLDVMRDGGRNWDCTMVGPEVIAALGVGVEAGVSGGMCTSRDGRRWLALGGSIGGGFGVGAIAGVHRSSPYFKGAGEVDAVSTYNLAAGVAIGLSGDNAPADPDSATVGAGLGIFVGKRLDGTVRVLPLGDARRQMITSLLNLD